MTDKCHYVIKRYLGTPHNYTLIFIIQNQVSKNVKAETINIYKGIINSSNILYLFILYNN